MLGFADSAPTYIVNSRLSMYPFPRDCSPVLSTPRSKDSKTTRAARHARCNPQRSALRVQPENIAHEKIAGTELLALTAHGKTEEQRLAEQILVLDRERLVNVGEDISRNAPIDLAYQVVMRCGNKHR